MEARLEKPHRIAGYCRISVDVEADRDNTSIENQKDIISDYVQRNFPDSELTFFVDRDRSGYTFEQREDYQRMRPYLMTGQYDILIIKDLSRFSRRNSRGLVELEDLRDAGVRIVAIGDSIDYPTHDDWTNIRLRFLLNEMPVTDSSQKVKSVISRRQQDGRWICAVPYGYVMKSYKMMTYEIDPVAAEVVRKIYQLYIDGWGYKRIANYLTENNIPTPRRAEAARKEALGEPVVRQGKNAWSIITIQNMLSNDFYIGTLRQGKYRRKGINGKDERIDESKQLVFENHHEPIIDYPTFAYVQEQMKRRMRNSYNGIRKYETPYTGLLYCGDCGSPMFSMSRKDLDPAYTCGTYHQRGRKGCTSHHTRVDFLDSILKMYIRKVKQNSAHMIKALEASIRDEKAKIDEGEQTQDMLRRQIESIKGQLKVLMRQKIAELTRKPDQAEMINEMYDGLEAEYYAKIKGLESQLALMADHRNNVIRINRVAKTALDIFDEILNKEGLRKKDIEFIVDRIVVYTDHIDIQLRSDIDALLHVSQSEEIEKAANGEHSQLSRKVRNHPEDQRRINTVYSSDPLAVYIVSVYTFLWLMAVKECVSRLFLD